MGALASANDTTLPPDFLDQLATTGGDKTLRLTLPDGHPAVGTITALNRWSGRVITLSGTIEHPEPGEFSLTCATAPDGAQTPAGTLSFASQSVIWALEPAPAAGRFQFVKKPVPDAFRPRNPAMPTAGKTPAETRTEAEAALRKSLKIEQLAPDRLRVGLVEIDRATRSVRVPAAVNMRERTVEYALVNESGKKHEAVFTTAAAPGDIHLALLLLGVKPAPLPTTGPVTAAVNLTVEWQDNGSTRSAPLADFLTIGTASAKAAATKAATGPWHYNGSRFNAAGFAATTEGSIISLIDDDLALVNNPGTDRADDAVHLPNTDKLPPLATPVTIVFRPASPPVSKP